MKKRVCIVRSNPVSPDSRVEKEVSALVDAGYAVFVLCWDRAGNHPIEIEHRIPDVIFVRLGFKASYGEGVKNLGAFLKFQIGIAKWLYRNQSSFDIIHACDFDTAYTSFRVAKWIKKKFVFDIFDFLCGEPQNAFQRYIKRAQLRIINKADATIICTEQRIEQIKGAIPKRLCVIHNTPPMIPNKKKYVANNGSKIKVAYVGILQDHRLLLEMGHFFSQNDQYELHIGGFGKYEHHFKELADRSDNILYYGKLQYEQTLKLEENCDIMTAIYDPKIENHRFAAPNKFYEALMLGKPLIMVEGTGMSEEVKKNDIGAVIEYSEEGLRKGLEYLKSNKSKWAHISERMEKLYQKKYDWAIMETRLVDLYQAIES